MGYNSHWEGALTPSKKIPDNLVEIINRMCLDVCVVTGTYEDMDSDGDVGDVVPACREMEGSNLAEDICRVQKLLDEHKTKIKLSGEINRTGDSTGDIEQFKVVRGVVYRRQGEIVDGKRIPVTLDRWAVRVKRQFKSHPGEWKTCGWVVTGGCQVRTAVAWSQSDTPPWVTARFESEDEAIIAAQKHTDKTHRCEVVKTEALR